MSCFFRAWHRVRVVKEVDLNLFNFFPGSKYFFHKRETKKMMNMKNMVERAGIEPAAFSMRNRRYTT